MINPTARSILVVLLSAAICTTAWARRTVTVGRAEKPPTIDGSLDDSCWQVAGRLTDFSVYRDPERKHPESTIGLICHDDENLYLAVRCEVNEMDKFRASMADDRLRNGQFVYGKAGLIEVFFDTKHDRKTFQQYMLHANGSIGVTLPKEDLLRILNEEYLQCRSEITDTGFTIESAFPLAMLHLRPDTAKVWGFNLNRVHDLYDERYDKNGFYSSWNSTRGAGFQTPELFGDLTFEADLSRFYWAIDFVREPQAGDSQVELRVQNQTGQDFSGTLALSISDEDSAATRFEQALLLKRGDTQTIRFDHFISARDAEASFRVALTDSVGQACYLGGTQKLDLTPADDWAPPAPTSQQEKAGFVLFRRPYTHPVLYKAVPRADEVIQSVDLAACRGEFEPVTFSIYPLRNLRSLSVLASALAGPDGASIPASAIDVRKVMWQSDWTDPRRFEAKEHLLRRFDSLDLAQSRTQRLWMTLKVPDSAPAGDYHGTITVSSDGVETHLALKVRVLPFELSAADGMGYFMYYPGVTHPMFSTPEFFAKTVKDMRDHGMTTFSIYNSVQVKDAQTGQLQADVDQRVGAAYGVTYAQMMELLREGGLGIDIPLLDVSAMNYDPKIIVELDEIARSRGWPPILFYINDEIEYASRIAAARKVLEAIKKLSPDIKTTTALGPKGAAALGHLYDVWIGCSTPEMIEKCLSMGQHPWTYSCRKVPDVSPAFERAFFGRFPWKIGLKGVSLWSYTENNTFYDRFGRQHDYKDFTFSPESKLNYGHVYYEDDQIIPAVTWEAVREGIDDYRYMLTLEKTAMAALKSDNTHSTGQAALKLLDEIADRTPLLNDDVKYGRAWKQLGDMDAERDRVIKAILAILKATKQQMPAA